MSSVEKYTLLLRLEALLPRRCHCLPGSQDQVRLASRSAPFPPRKCKRFSLRDLDEADRSIAIHEAPISEVSVSQLTPILVRLPGQAMRPDVQLGCSDPFEAPHTKSISSPSVSWAEFSTGLFRVVTSRTSSSASLNRGSPVTTASRSKTLLKRAPNAPPSSKNHPPRQATEAPCSYEPVDRFKRSAVYHSERGEVAVLG